MGKSIRETSRILGDISHEGLRRALKRGTITAEKDGTLDPKKVRKQLRANTHPGRGKGGGAAAEANGDAGGGPTYQKARTFRETYRAKIEELEYKRLMRELVPVSEVRRVTFERARRARDLFISIPARLAPVVAGLHDTRECMTVMEDEIARVLDELADPAKDEW